MMSMGSFLHRASKPEVARIAFQVLGLSLAALGVLVSLQAEVLGKAGFWGALKLPFERLGSESPPRLKLSSLLGSARSNPVDGEKMPPPLYVFALDISGSMANEKITPAERELFRQDLAAVHPAERIQNCLNDALGATGYDIAKIELCRYLEAVPADSRVALWTFSDVPRQVIPPESQTNGERYTQVATTVGGGSTKNLFYSTIRHLSSPVGNTNFQELLARLHSRYSLEIASSERLHFIFISDFDHDQGATGADEDRHRWDGAPSTHCRISRALLKELFASLTGPKTTFHFSQIDGARGAVCSVLPTVKNVTPWWSQRMVTMQPQSLTQEFDFLQRIEEVEEVLPFYFEAGDARPLPAMVEIDDPNLEGARIRLALASDSGEIDPGLQIQVLFDDELPGLIQNGAAHVGEVSDQGELIQFQPHRILESSRSEGYRVLISWKKRGLTPLGSNSACTYAVRLSFQRRLDKLSAVSIAGAIVFFAGSAMWLVLFALVKIVTPGVGAKPDEEVEAP